MKINDELISLQEAATILGLNPETLRRWDRNGKLKAIKVNERGDRRFAKSDILKFLNDYKKNKLFGYKGYEVVPYSFGFEQFPDRFGTIAKYIVRKEDIVSGFAFAVPGLALFSLPHLTELDLENMAYERIKNLIDQNKIKHLQEYTFEFTSGNFLQVSNPAWWFNK